MNWLTKKGAIAVTCTQCSYSKDKCILPRVSLTNNPDAADPVNDTTAATPPPTPAPPKAKAAKAKPRAKTSKAKSKKATAKAQAACKCISTASQY
jgi:hypothetical protein